MITNRLLRLSVRLLPLIAALGISLPAQAAAEDFPAKPIRIIIGFPPGGNADLVARLMSQKMPDMLGQPVIVENKPGAGGAIASSFVAKAAPDGYTLLLALGAFTAQGAMQKALPFDPVRDFSWISLLGTYAFVVGVKSDSPYRTLAELIAQAKRNPGKMHFPGPLGTLYHLSGEMFNSMAGTDIVHIPYRGGSDAVTELLGGRMDVIFEAVATALPHIQSGTIRALAVTSKDPVRSLPNVPPVSETIPRFDVTSFVGMAGPAGMPPAVVDRLNRDIRRFLELSDIQQRFYEWGGQAAPSTPAEMRSHVETEIQKWKEVVKARNITLQ
jgi:tripartite-type tricarboxylate transporter receptor subunit TctC